MPSFILWNSARQQERTATNKVENLSVPPAMLECLLSYLNEEEDFGTSLHVCAMDTRKRDYS